MHILCIAKNEAARNQGIAITERNGWKVRLVGGVGIGGLPGFLVEAKVSEHMLDKALMVFSSINLDAEQL